MRSFIPSFVVFRIESMRRFQILPSNMYTRALMAASMGNASSSPFAHGVASCCSLCQERIDSRSTASMAGGAAAPAAPTSDCHSSASTPSGSMAGTGGRPAAV